MDLASLEDWLGRYFDAWRSNDPEAVAGLFARDAVYFVNPFEGPRMLGRREIVEQWTRDPEGQRDVRSTYEPLAAQGDLGVAHWNVSFAASADGRRTEMDGILVLRFDDNGRCVEHREWYVRRDVPA